MKQGLFLERSARASGGLQKKVWGAFGPCSINNRGDVRIQCGSWLVPFVIRAATCTYCEGIRLLCANRIRLIVEMRDTLVLKRGNDGMVHTTYLRGLQVPSSPAALELESESERGEGGKETDAWGETTPRMAAVVSESQ